MEGALAVASTWPEYPCTPIKVSHCRHLCEVSDDDAMSIIIGSTSNIALWSLLFIPSPPLPDWWLLQSQVLSQHGRSWRFVRGFKFCRTNRPQKDRTRGQPSLSNPDASRRGSFRMSLHQWNLTSQNQRGNAQMRSCKFRTFSNWTN